MFFLARWEMGQLRLFISSWHVIWIVLSDTLLEIHVCHQGSSFFLSRKGPNMPEYTQHKVVGNP
jgi:hypothetical protein